MKISTMKATKIATNAGEFSWYQIYVMAEKIGAVTPRYDAAVGMPIFEAQKARRHAAGFIGIQDTPNTVATAFNTILACNKKIKELGGTFPETMKAA
jgi:hypothetical protein